MGGSKGGSKRSSHANDDAPELTTKSLATGQWTVGGRPVSPEEGRAAFRQAMKRGRPRSQAPRTMVSLRIEQDVLAALRATGRGWQTRVNALLREAVLKKRG